MNHNHFYLSRTIQNGQTPKIFINPYILINYKKAVHLENLNDDDKYRFNIKNSKKYF